MIGAAIKAGVAYWIIFGIFCAFKLAQAIGESIEKMDK